MVSAERVMAYGKLESEASLETDPLVSKLPSDWPSEGHLEINDLSYRHSPEGPLVLKGITCTVNSGEKVKMINISFVLHGMRIYFKCSSSSTMYSWLHLV